MRTGAVLAFMTFVALVTAGEAAEPPKQDETPAVSDPLVVAVERYAEEDENYTERVEEYRTAQANGTALADEQKRRYSNAYVYGGCLLYRQANAEGAAGAFRQAAGIDETNPLPLYCLGLLCRKCNSHKAAVENFYAAAKLGGPLKDACRGQLKEIRASVLERAEAATKKGNPTEAAQCYLFLINNFPGKTKAAALKKLEAVEDASDPMVVAVERYAAEAEDYRRLLEEYRAAQANGTLLTAAQKRRTSNAYVYHGYALYWHQDADGAKASFDQAIALDEKNALAHFCLGILERKRRRFKSAAESLRTGRDLGGPLNPWCRKHLNEIAISLLDEAKALIQRNRYVDAAKRYRFLAKYFDGTTKTNAVALLKEHEDEIKAEQLVIRGQQLMARGHEAEGRKWLEQCLTTYAWTHAAETAKKILRGGDVTVKVKYDSWVDKYAKRERWIDLETANFIIYCKDTEYAKIITQRVEEVLKRVTKQLNYTTLDWSKDKCKIFIFEDNDAWSAFKKDTDNEDWVVSFNPTGSREIYIGSDDRTDMLDRLIPDHIAGIIHQESVRKDTYMPEWLSDGFSRYHGFVDKKEWYYDPVKQALASGAFIPLIRLTSSSGKANLPVILFFAEAEMLVEFIIDRFGNEGLVRLHKRLRKDYEFEDLTRKAFDMKFEEFEKEWLEYIRKKVATVN